MRAGTQAIKTTVYPAPLGHPGPLPRSGPLYFSLGSRANVIPASFPPPSFPRTREPSAIKTTVYPAPLDHPGPLPR